MPKRFLSRSARAERPSPCPLSQMIWARVQPAGCPYSSWHSSAASTISTVMYGGRPASEAFEAASLQNPKTALAIWETASAARTKHSTPDRIPARGPAAAAAAAAALPPPPFAAARAAKVLRGSLPTARSAVRGLPGRRRAAFSAARPRRRARPSPARLPLAPSPLRTAPVSREGAAARALPATLHAPFPARTASGAPSSSSESSASLSAAAAIAFFRYAVAVGAGARRRPPSSRTSAGSPFSTGVRSGRRFRLAAEGGAGRRDLPGPVPAALPPCAGTANLSSPDTRPALTASVLPDDAIPSAPDPSALTGRPGGAPPDAAGSERRVSLVTSRSPRRLSSSCSRRAS